MAGTDTNAPTPGAPDPTPRATLSQDFVALLRQQQNALRRDVIRASTGLAMLLRLLSGQIEYSTRENRDVLVSVGIVLSILGETLRDEALKS